MGAQGRCLKPYCVVFWSVANAIGSPGALLPASTCVEEFSVMSLSFAVMRWNFADKQDGRRGLWVALRVMMLMAS